MGFITGTNNLKMKTTEAISSFQKAKDSALTAED